MAIMKDVAELAGVSVATVSNVLTGKQTVSPKVRERVLSAIQELDYHINLNARGLKTTSTRTIGVVLPDITKLFFNDMLKGIMDTAAATGYMVSVLSSNYDAEQEWECISSQLSSNVDGIIVDSCVDHEKLGEYAAMLSSKNSPVISLENPMDDHLISSVSIDAYYWSSKMTSYLAAKGKRRIFYISGQKHLGHECDRLEGYKQALCDFNLPLDKNLIVYGDYSSKTAFDLVSSACLKGQVFDAVQASNDQAAIGALKALVSLGYAVPEQVYVTGFDNLFPSTLVSPAITTIDVPRYDLGCEAVRECLRHIEDPDIPPRRIVLSAKLITRASTGEPDSTPWDLFYW